MENDTKILEELLHRQVESQRAQLSESNVIEDKGDSAEMASGDKMPKDMYRQRYKRGTL